MGKPCFRIVQTHFAAADNVGDVAAKEEVRSVCLPVCLSVASPCA
jgi:hypothetical protein